MTREEYRPTLTQSEEEEMNMSQAEEESRESLTQSQLSKRVLRKLDFLFYELFDYLEMCKNKMENDAYGFLKQLKETYKYRGQYNEEQINLYDRLIEKIRRVISSELRYVYMHEDYIIPAKFFQDAFDEYRNEYAIIFGFKE